MRYEIKQNYDRWYDRADLSRFEGIESHYADEEQLFDAFYRDLAFGTGGLRGIIGFGPNRMNDYTVAKATQGLANYLNEHFESPTVAIARDSRDKGEDFIRVAAEVLAANGIPSLLYPRIEPTPALSFAVRHFKCAAGICITASHNPAEYNGYKVYGSDGCQITTRMAVRIQDEINSVDVFDDVKRVSFEEGYCAGLITWIEDEVLDQYVDAVLAQSRNVNCTDLKVAYTPLHGAGLEPMLKVISGIGVTDLALEPSQVIADGSFPTCPKPNPEECEALQLGLSLAEREKADVLIATDPDADRLGVAIRHNGSLVLMNGNEIGAVLLDFLCAVEHKEGRGVGDRVVVTTIVSAPIVDAMAQDYGFELRRTLTGFKYIGEQIGILEDEGQKDRFLFGFEESYGYLVGSYVRDKDAMVAAMLLCQAVSWYQNRGLDLIDVLDSLYARYGYQKTALMTCSYPGAGGIQRMEKIMCDLRKTPPAALAGVAVVSIVDYRSGVHMPTISERLNAREQTLPPADVFELRLEGGAKVIVRPSGTEPKIKAYLSVDQRSHLEADGMMNPLKKDVLRLLK